MHKRILVLTLCVIASNVAVGGAETEPRLGEGAMVGAAVPVPAETHRLLIQAIREKRVLRFTYNGHPRVVEPHAYGVSATGEVVLHAFQIEGDSASKPPPGWRTFNVGLLENLAPGEVRFDAARPGYSREEPVLTPVWAALETT